MKSATVSNRLGFVAAVAGLAGAALLTGCSGLSGSLPASETFAAPASIEGNVHGGQSPIFNAVVRLYATGTSGYGAGSTLLATSANTDASGNFSFTKLGTTGGVINSALPTWQCPASGNPQIYITATGGNTQGTTSTSTNNTASVLIADLGTCSTVTSNTHVVVNELTTAATVFAMAQYINPGTTAGTETIGTSSSAQGTVGLNNAAANIANLVYVNYGSPVTSIVYPGTGTAAGATLTATPESAKLITIANILAACVNTVSSSSAQCADLFANATPPLSASITSQPTQSLPTAVDTMQAAYYLATNPASNGTFTSCQTSSATTKIGCLYGLVTTGAPFQTGLSAAPSDWTVGISFSGSGACVNGDFLVAAPYHASIDANGNIWYINGGSTTASLVELSPVGQPLQCLGNLSNGRGLTIDVNGNVWAIFNGTATNGIIEIPGGSSTAITWPITSGAQAYQLTSDGYGNVYFNQNASGGTIWEFVNPGTTTTPFAPVQIAGPLNGTSSVTQGYLQVDPQGRLWDATSTTQLLFDVYPTKIAITGYSVSGGTVTFNATNSLAVGNQVNVSGLTTTEGLLLDNQVYTVTAANASSFSAATSAANIGATTDAGNAYTTGSANAYTAASLTTVNTSYGIGIDSNNYIYQGTTCCAGTGDREVVKWTPGSAGTATYSASSQNFAGVNGVRSIVVDGASNVFVGAEYPNSSGATTNSGTYSVSEFTTAGSGTTATFTAISNPGTVPGTCSTTAGCPTTGGYFDSDFQEPLDMQIDPSGNLWVLNTYNYAVTTVSGNGLTVTELVGAAVPVVTPLSVAVRNNQLGTKP